MITENTTVRITKGCKAIDVAKYATAKVLRVEEQERKMAKVVLKFNSNGRVKSVYVRHMNRLSDPVVRANDGNPLNVVEFERALS